MPVMDTLKDQAGSVMASVTELNQIALDKVEAFNALALSAANYYSDVGMKQLRAVSSVKSPEALRSFAAESISTSGEVAKRMLEDSKAVMGLNAEMRDEVKTVFSRKPAEEAAAKPAARKPAAAKAAE